MKQLKLIVFILSFVFLSNPLYSQNDNVGSGRAIEFDGVDDYIDFGDHYSDLTLPFTISAWVYLDPSKLSTAPIFTNRNCSPIYQGFRLVINASVISVEYGDGLGGNSPAFRRGKLANVTGLLGRWNHVTAVVRDVFDMDLYLNGVNVGGSPSGDSYNTMVSNVPGVSGFTSSAYFTSNDVIYRYHGLIDEIRFWNRSLSQEEIRQTMCVNLKGNERGLIGYWDFNETSGDIVFDKSSNKFNGQFVGNPKRVFSGAPIGDISTYLYATSLSGKTVFLQDGDHKIDVKKIEGIVEGVQLYEVNSSPSQTTGLDLNDDNKLYFGVFLVNQNSESAFDAEYSFQGLGSCTLSLRDDNSVPSWDKGSNPTIGKLQRSEFIKASEENTVSFDLGPDKSLCDQPTYQLSTGITDPRFSFQWNTGQNTSSIEVTKPGLYSVKVFGSCDVTKDSVTISQIKKSDIGFVPNIITPNGDPKNECFVVDESIVGLVSLKVFNRWGKEVYYSSAYDNRWNGGDLSSGVYYILLEGSCIEKTKSPLSIIR